MKAILLLTLWSASSFAMTDADYQAQASRLKARQAETDTLMKRLGATSGFNSPTSQGRPGGDDEKPVPLFQIHGELSSARLSVGKILYGRTLNRLVVGPDGSPAIIEIDYDQNGMSGLRLMGIARQAGTQGRLVIDFTKLLLRSGRAVAMQATSLDSAGAYGLEAQVFSSKALAVAGSIATSFISGLAAAQQSQASNPFGFGQTQTTGRNAILQGVAQTAADQSKRFIEEATTEKPVLVLEALTSVSILIQEEVHF